MALVPLFPLRTSEAIERATCRSIVDFLHKDERYPKLDAFVYENGGYRWRVPKTRCS